MQECYEPMIKDVEEMYVKYRKKGCTRSEAIELIRHQYACELEDDDDRVVILIGISLALCKKKELLETIATETLQEITRVNCEKAVEEEKKFFTKVERRLKDKNVYGNEATYKRKTIYVPDWKCGDVFSHILTYPSSEKLGIKGWVILLYKAGEYVDKFEDHHQLVYVWLCPPDKVPVCKEDFEKLDFLPMMYMGDWTEYLAQIEIKSKKAEETFGLTKIGCFPNLLLPGDPAKENPLTAMPLFGKLRRTDFWPAYENQICILYRAYMRRNK